MIPIWMLTYLATWKERCEGEPVWRVWKSFGWKPTHAGMHWNRRWRKRGNIWSFQTLDLCRQGGRTSNPTSCRGARRRHGNHSSHGTKGDLASGGLGIYWVPLPQVILDGVMIMEGISCSGYVISFMSLSQKIEHNWCVQTFWQLSDVVKSKSCEFGCV